MITRGIIIGKIVDDLSSLKYQVDTRNKLGQFDLTKFCEDFFREVLNTTYTINLRNLNDTRSNEPGIDLGDEKAQLAFQVTSKNKLSKVHDTLNKITEDQKMLYKRIKIFIVGKKQGSYALKNEITSPFSFTENDIIDIDSILKDIVVLDLDKLEILYSLFRREFRQVKIELEPLDKEGNFESSYYNTVESKPSSPPKNALKFCEHCEDEDLKETLEGLLLAYRNLSSVPRVTRELLAIIVDRGKIEKDLDYGESYSILPEALERFLRISQSEMIGEINILENSDLVHLDEGYIGERVVHLIKVNGTLNEIFFWLKENGISIRNILNTMDFTVLDEEEV